FTPTSHVLWTGQPLASLILLSKIRSRRNWTAKLIHHAALTSLRRSRLFGQLPGKNKLKASSRLLVSPFPDFAAFGISKRCGGLDLARTVPSLSHAASKALGIFAPYTRACAVRARDHQNSGPSNPAGRTLTYTLRGPHAPHRKARRSGSDKG